jgi:DNA-binding NarL/FixJ family response regulator
MRGRPLVLVADDHAPLRAGVRLVLEAGGYDVLEAVDGASAVAVAKQEKPDVCLVDIDMPGNGIQAAKAIVAQVPASRVVMLTVSISESDVLAALRAGAWGYLVKGKDDGPLAHVLDRILAGEPAVPRRFVSLLLDRVSRSSGRSILLEGGSCVRLTRREAEVVELLRQDLTTAEIAMALHISPVTVRRYISDVVQRLDAPSRAAALELLDRAALGPDRAIG